MPISIEGKRIVVTGSAQGIGAAALVHFVREGAQVVAFDRLPSGEDVVAQANNGGPGKAWFRQVDVSDPEQVRSGLAQAVETLGGLDVLFNIAGIELGSPAETIPGEDWSRLFGVNVFGLANMCQAAFPHLKEHGGAIINVGSDAALGPYPNGAHYSASKGAVTSYSRTLSHEWGKYGIRVNTLAPAMWTPMYDGHRARMSPEALAAHDAKMRAVIPLGGKLGNPETDLAPVLAFLASDAARFITGQIISVNGGAGHTR